MSGWMFWILLVYVTCCCATKSPSFGDIVSDSEMVATFQHNEPNIDVSPPGHRRHYQLVAPEITFGDTRVDLVSDTSEGFFSSYERKQAQTIFLLQAKHKGANSSLACLMPGQAFDTGITDPESPLYAFEPMMTCNLQITSHITGPVELVFDVASQQNDRVVVEQTQTVGGVLLRREDAKHLLRTIGQPVGNATLKVDRYPARARFVITWPTTSTVNLQFHTFVVSTKEAEISRDQRILALFLTVSFGTVVICVVCADCFKAKFLFRDAVRKNHSRALAASNMTSVTMTTSFQLAAAQREINTMQRS